MVAWSFLSLSPACVQRGRGGPRARVSTTFCSLSTKTGRMGKTIMQSHDNTTHDTAVLLFMSEAESEIRRRPCRDVWVIKPYMPYIDGGRASQKGTRTSITDHGSSEKAREREKGSNQIISREFDGVKPNPRSFPSDPIRSRWFAIFSCGTELGICWTSDVRWKTSIQ